MLTVTRVVAPVCVAEGEAAAIAAPTQAAAPATAIARKTLRKPERIDDVSVARWPLLVAVSAAAALQHRDVLLAVRQVRDPRSADPDLEVRREVPEVLAGLGVVRAVRRIVRVVVAGEDEPACGGKRGAVAVAERRQPHRPRNRVRPDVDGLQVAASRASLVRVFRHPEARGNTEAETDAEEGLSRDPLRQLGQRIRLDGAAP